ncbi:MAG: starch-binding protein [Clostridia bacterium]|nr:starch-binding protein [Clostridia bacterium]
MKTKEFFGNIKNKITGLNKNQRIGIIAGCIGAVILIVVVTLCATLIRCDAAGFGTPKGLSYSNSEETFTWEAVDGADGYMVSVNEADEFYITETSLSMSDSRITGNLIDKELNVLYVRAVTVDEDGNVITSSEKVSYEFDYVAPVLKEWKVTFNLNYDGAPKAEVVPVMSGEKVVKPENPQRNGWKFEGWCRDKECLISVSFNAAGQGIFDVTGNMTLYAKWSVDQSVKTTSIYYYSESASVTVKPYKGEAELFNGKGIAMTSVPGKNNWFKADIDETATSVIFTDGENANQSLTFDKTKPYCKDGAWTATMPTDTPVVTDDVVTITVGSGTPQQLKASEDVDGEYTITLTLNVGDTVTIKFNGETLSTYKAGCSFTGTATVEGAHTFYVTKTQIDVEAPEAPAVESTVVLIINGNTATAQKFVVNENDDENIEQEVTITVTLNKDDTVVIKDGDLEYKYYEPDCKFRGKATVDGEYTFYAKLWKDGGNSVWVTVPADFVPPEGDSSVVLIINGETDKAVHFETAAADAGVAKQARLVITLNKDDTVVIKDGDVEYSNYEKGCPFNGKATVEGSYTFYAKLWEDGGTSVWVTVPEGFETPVVGDSKVVLIINGTADSTAWKEHPTDEPGVTVQYMVTVTLAEGATVVIKNGDKEFEFQNKDEFGGSVTLEGEYTFYAKIMTDGRLLIWTIVPTVVPTTATTVYYYNSEGWANVYLYCWNNKTEERPEDWPGVKMTAVGNGWFMLEIEPGYDKVIFNKGTGGEGNQTGNLTLEVTDGKAYYNFNGVTDARPQ